MSKPKIEGLRAELESVYDQYRSNKWLMVETLLQIMDREKIAIANKYRQRAGELPKDYEEQRYKPNTRHKWFKPPPTDKRGLNL